MPTIYMSQQLSKYMRGCAAHHSDSRTIQEVFAELQAAYPALNGPIFADDGAPQPFIGVFVNGEPVTAGQAGPLPADGEVVFVNAVAGG